MCHKDGKNGVKVDEESHIILSKKRETKEKSYSQKTKSMKKIKSIFIYIIATIIIVLTSPLGFLYTAIKNIFTFRFLTWLTQIQSYFMVLVIALDQYANVMMRDLFNDTMLKKKTKTYPFGNPDDTIGFVVRKNNKKDNLTLFGKFLLLIIDHKK
jgi:cation transport ATPase